jgi:hypothetical protein
LIEAQLGAKPEVIRTRINNQEQRLANIEARQEAEFFASSNPDYYPDVENFRTITAWMVKNGLSPVRENFQLAYDTLRKEGLIIQAPQPERIENVNITPPIQVIPPVQPVPVIAPIPVAVPNPSGLTRDFTSAFGTPVPKTTLTIRDVERMPSEEYKRRLREDKTFATQVNELYAKKPVNDPRV